MSASTTLASLRGLQALREQRSKADHARTVRAERDANQKRNEARAELDARNDALDHYASQGVLQIERFQIFAQLIVQSEAQVEARAQTHEDAREQEASARQSRLRAEKQTEQLALRHGEAVSKERRKAEESKARDFLSQKSAISPAHKGARA